MIAEITWVMSRLQKVDERFQAATASLERRAKKDASVLPRFIGTNLHHSRCALPSTDGPPLTIGLVHVSFILTHPVRSDRKQYILIIQQFPSLGAKAKKTLWSPEDH